MTTGQYIVQDTYPWLTMLTIGTANPLTTRESLYMVFVQYTEGSQAQP